MKPPRLLLAALLLCAPLLAHAQGTSIAVNALPRVANPTTSDLFIDDQANATYAGTLGQLVSLVITNLSAGAVTNLWSGPCNSTNYLRGDGVCATPPGGGGSGTVTTTGSPDSGNLTKFSGSTSITNGDLSGDCTTSGTLAVTCTKTSGTLLGTFATQNYASPPVLGGTTPNDINAIDVNVTGTDVPANAGINSCAANSHSTQLCFYSAGTLAGLIDDLGNWIDNAGPQAVSITGGFNYLPAVTGVPTGTPSRVSGNGYGNPPMIQDNADFRLYQYASGAWHNIGDNLTNATALSLGVTGTGSPSGGYGINECAAGSLCFYAGGSNWTQVDQAGNVLLAPAAIATSATNGFVYFTSSAGAPTGTPVTTTGGGYANPPCVLDSTNVRIDCYIGGAWKGFTSTDIQQNAQTANYTLVASDDGKEIYHNSGTAHTFTIPANASVPYAIGTCIMFTNSPTGGTVTIAITSDTLYYVSDTGSRTLQPYGSGVACKKTATTWYINGTGIGDLIAPLSPAWAEGGRILGFGEAANDAMFEVRSAA